MVVIKHTCDIVKAGFDTDQKLFFPETFRLLQRPTSLTCRMQTITSELSLICTYKWVYKQRLSMTLLFLWSTFQVSIHCHTYRNVNLGLLPSILPRTVHQTERGCGYARARRTRRLPLQSYSPQFSSWWIFWRFPSVRGALDLACLYNSRDICNEIHLL